MKKSVATLAVAVMMNSTAFAPVVLAQTNPAPMAPSTQAPATGAAPMAPRSSDSSAAAMGTYLTQQSPTQISANDYIGQNVYNAANENVGTISDLILEKDGGIVAAIIGVGGFLGMGAKDVAVPMASITVNTAADTGDLRLTTMETADALKAAPTFMTLQERRSMMNPDNTTMPATGTNTGTNTGTTTRP